MPTVTDITGNSSTPEQLAVPYGPVRGPQATVALRGTRRDDETIIAMAASWRETAQNHQAAAEAYAQRTMHLQSELTALLDAVRQREVWWRDGVANMANHIGSERHRCVSLEQQAEQEWSEKVLALEQGLTTSELTVSDHQRMIQEQQGMMLNAEVNVTKLYTDQAAKLTDADAAVTRLRNELVAAQVAANASTINISDANLRYVSETRHNESLTAEVSELRASENALRIAHDTARQSLDEQRAAALAVRVEELEQELAQERRERFRSQERHQSAYDRVNSDLEHLRTRFDNLQGENDDLKQKVKSLQDELVDWERQYEHQYDEYPTAGHGPSASSASQIPTDEIDRQPPTRIGGRPPTILGGRPPDWREPAGGEDLKLRRRR